MTKSEVVFVVVAAEIDLAMDKNEEVFVVEIEVVEALVKLSVNS
jgi:hypothetical protein